ALEGINNLGGAKPGARHAHIQRTIAHEGKAALGFIELHRRDAEIENNTIDGIPANLGNGILETGKGCLDKAQASLILGFKATASRNRRRIAIKRQHFAVDCIENCARVSARAKGTINEALTWLRFQDPENFRKQHWDVTDRSAIGAWALYP